MIIIYYTGVGANKNGLHTESEFISKMKRNFIKDSDEYSHLYKKYKLKQWIEFSGAIVIRTKKV